MFTTLAQLLIWNNFSTYNRIKDTLWSTDSPHPEFPMCQSHTVVVHHQTAKSQSLETYFIGFYKQ